MRFKRDFFFFSGRERKKKKDLKLLFLLTFTTTTWWGELVGDIAFSCFLFPFSTFAVRMGEAKGEARGAVCMFVRGL